MSSADWFLLRNPRAPRPLAWTFIPPPLLQGSDDPAGYDADQELLDAANVAIELGQPLLLTGEPGCGKSAFADHVAWQLGLGKALRFQARTNMEMHEVFYTYDSLSRFRAIQEGSSFAPEDFLTLQALGEAIVKAADPADDRNFRTRLLQEKQPIPVRSVVLIDEVDKAPRDVPNDLLGFLTGENLWFEVTELNRSGAGIARIESIPKFRPIVIFTSNSEKLLPEPFLRRCVYHNITFPDYDRLRRIVSRRVTGLVESDPLLRDVEALVKRIRDHRPLKPPGVAEVMSFVLALRARGYSADSLLDPAKEDWKRIGRNTLLKQKEDQESYQTLFLQGIEGDSDAV